MDDRDDEIDLVGIGVEAAYNLVYRGEGSEESSGGLELIVADGSVLFWSGTDWALRVERGSWPILPDWAWPPEAWTFSRVNGPGDRGLDEVTSISWRENEVGETVGVIIGFADGDLMASSGADFGWSFERRAP